MKLPLAALLTVLAIGSANAQYGLQTLPPVKFDHPYAGKLTIKVMPNDQAMWAACPRSIAKYGASSGCAFPSVGSCLIYVRDQAWYRKQGGIGYYNALLRHEIGHCNGWGADHNGGRIGPCRPDEVAGGCAEMWRGKKPW